MKRDGDRRTEVGEREVESEWERERERESERRGEKGQVGRERLRSEETQATGRRKEGKRVRRERVWGDIHFWLGTQLNILKEDPRITGALCGLGSVHPSDSCCMEPTFQPTLSHNLSLAGESWEREEEMVHFCSTHSLMCLKGLDALSASQMAPYSLHSVVHYKKIAVWDASSVCVLFCPVLAHPGSHFVVGPCRRSQKKSCWP